MDYKKMYEELVKEFNQYQSESIKWSVEDFTEYAPTIGYIMTEEQAQDALYHMIDDHDCEYGITWHTVAFFIEMYGTEILNQNNKN
jgi:hypothetical protein